MTGVCILVKRPRAWRHNDAYMAGAIDATLRKFHASFNVSDLPRSIEFYRQLLGVEPAKVREDYAKFDLAEPPLVLSLIPGKPVGTGHLNHAGLRMRTAEELVEVQRRLEAAGMPTQREEGVECCYARQTKFWINDPDGALWEIYVFDEDIVEHGQDAPPRRETFPVTDGPEPRRIVHRLGEPYPASMADADGTVDELHLQGSLNAGDPTDRGAFLAEACRALRSGGTVKLRGLAGDAECASVSLPGPAAGVRYVPTAGQIVDELRAAGFGHVTIDVLGQNPCFHAGSTPLREIRVSARKPERVITAIPVAPVSCCQS